MTASSNTILAAYQKMHTKKEVVKTIVEAEEPKAEEKKEEVKEEPKAEEKNDDKVVADAVKAGKASKPGTYLDFTGNIRTPGVYGTVEKANFTINADNTVSWSKGTWLDGTWSGRASTWNGGTWKNGTWKAGMWTAGTWENGTHLGGVFSGGTWKNGVWDYGVFDGATWEDGMWKDGDWDKSAKWIKGRDVKGNEHTDAPFHWGGMKYSKTTDPSQAAIKREKSARYSEVFRKSDDPRTMDTFDDEADKNAIAAQAEHGKSSLGESMKISEAVKRHLKGTKILGSMLVKENEDETDTTTEKDEDAEHKAFTKKLEKAVANKNIKEVIAILDAPTFEDNEDNEYTAIGVFDDIVIDSKNPAMIKVFLDRNLFMPLDPDTVKKMDTTDEIKDMLIKVCCESTKVDEAKKTKEDIKKLELNDAICLELEDATLENLEAVKQFIADGFKCLTDEEREELANAEHEATETPEEEAKEVTTGVEDEVKIETK